MSHSHGESSHSRASESPALNPASSDRSLTPTDDANNPVSEVLFCSSAAIFNPKIEKAYRNETNRPPRLATPLRLVTLPEDQPIPQSKPGRAPNTSNPRNPVEGSNMGNIFGSKKKKKKNAQKEDDEEIWKKMGANDSSTSLPPDAKKKNKKKKAKKSKRVESPSPPRGGDGSLKGKDPKRYAMYEPQSNSKDPQTHAVRSRTLPARVDPSEFRKSIGDPMDFRMADDVSPAGSPGYATPETATPPVQKSPGPIYKKINVNRERKTKDRSLPDTPKMNNKDTASQPVDSKTGKVAEMKKQHSVPTPGTGSPRPRGYILPSPPSRPKFYATEPGSASPKLLRVQPQKPVTLNSSSDDSSYSNKDKLAALRANSKPRNMPRSDQAKNNNRKDVHGIHVGDPGQESSQVDQQNRLEAFDIAMQKENEENERNLKREERRKKAAVADMQAAPNLEECQKIKETVVEAVESRITESEKHEVTSGPKVAILSTIPPPEKAVLSHVPPPSPSAMDALCEENEDDDLDDENADDDDDSDNHVTYRRSKEVEEFGGIVCQRLSQLLESQDDGTLKLQFIESNDPSSSLSPASPCMVMSGGSDLDRERMEDAGLGYSSMSPPMETENVYKEKSIPKKLLCVEMTKPSTFSQRLERSSISTRSTQGSNSASDLDGRVNYRDSKSPRSRDFIRDRRENESEISSSEEESSYTSDSEYSSRGYDEKRDHVTSYRENEYSIPWDLHRFPRSASYTSDGLDMSDSDLFYEHEVRNKPDHAQIAHVQRNARHGRKMREQDISDCDDMSDGRWVEYPQEKYQKDSRLNKSRQVSVEELRIEPISVKRQLFALPTHLYENDAKNEIEEPEIKPSFISSENTSSHIPKRGSEMMSDVIDAYTSEEMAVTKRKAPIVPPKRQSTLSEEILIEQPSNPSALDKSLKKIFSQDDEIEERYPELAPLHSLILGVEEGGTPSVEPFFEFRPGQLPTFTRVPLGSRRSLAYSESDLDMSEQRDDISSDNMDADDEDDEEGGIVMLDRRDLDDEEVVYGRTYGDVNRRVEVKRSRVIIEQEASEGEDSVFI
ncbi:lysine-specific demethylase 9-like isoform X2 [Pecten maximus]|uniref:lysine-specific demethylase 9-like isoform X2 n=1 Tax=Pecten maximus TaxID=6579 RepID=UPI001457F3BC|nr:lysine-specific demethylase 9-like isoform X2 [Pecten maximus]